MTGESKEAALLRDVQTLFGLGVVGGLTDGQLLDQFLTTDDATAEAAFTSLVERHGAMVLHVCRQTLDDPHDAQDAFQATFLVFLRRAGSIRKRESVASWLFGVALRVARQARYAAVVRRFHERRSGKLAAARAAAESELPECRAALHEEIDRLPDRYREPVVLCHLEGLFDGRRSPAARLCSRDDPLSAGSCTRTVAPAIDRSRFDRPRRAAYSGPGVP